MLTGSDPSAIQNGIASLHKISGLAPWFLHAMGIMVLLTRAYPRSLEMQQLELRMPGADIRPLVARLIKHQLLTGQGTVIALQQAPHDIELTDIYRFCQPEKNEEAVCVEFDEPGERWRFEGLVLQLEQHVETAIYATLRTYTLSDFASERR